MQRMIIAVIVCIVGCVILPSVPDHLIELDGTWESNGRLTFRLYETATVKLEGITYENVAYCDSEGGGEWIPGGGRILQMWIGMLAADYKGAVFNEYEYYVIYNKHFEPYYSAGVAYEMDEFYFDVEGDVAVGVRRGYDLGRPHNLTDWEGFIAYRQ